MNSTKQSLRLFLDKKNAQLLFTIVNRITPDNIADILKDPVDCTVEEVDAAMWVVFKKLSDLGVTEPSSKAR